MNAQEVTDSSPGRQTPMPTTLSGAVGNPVVKATAMQLMHADLPSPVIVLSGTLGSGKTRTLDRMLGAIGSSSYVVIENDIGTSNVDAYRLPRSSTGQVIGMNSGCICCQDIDSLRIALRGLRDAAPDTFRPDRIFIETTGVAEPGQVRDVLRELGFPHRILVTLDVRNFERNLELGRLKGHIEAADAVLLTHWDHLPEWQDGPTDHPALAYLHAKNPNAPVSLLSRRGEIMHGSYYALVNPPRQRLQMACSSHGDAEGCALHHHHELVPEPTVVSLGIAGRSPDQNDRHHDDGHSHHHGPPHGVYPISIALVRGVTTGEILNELQRLRASGIEFLRAKGRASGMDFDLVHDEFTVEQAGESLSGASINLIATSPIPPDAFQALRSQEQQPTGINPTEEAARLLVELSARYPTSPYTDRGTLAVDFEADEGEKYALMTGVPRELAVTYWARNVEARLRAVAELPALEAARDPLAPYYLKRLGSYLSWIQVEHASEIAEAGLTERVAQALPAALLFRGIQLTPPAAAHELGALTEWRTGFYPEIARHLSDRVGPAETLRLVVGALRHAVEVSPDDSWRSRVDRVLDDVSRALVESRPVQGF